MEIPDIFQDANGKHGKPLPIPNAEVRMSDTQGEWTKEQVQGLLCNPIYTGMGPFPAIVTDEQWVRSATEVIAQEGAEQFLVNLLTVLRSCLKYADPEE